MTTINPFVVAVFLKAVQDEIAEIRAAHDAPLKELFGRGDKKTVREGEGDSEVELGAVYKTNPRKTWKVVDRPAFIRWVQDNHPDCVVHVPQVVEAWEKDFLKGLGKTGEIPDGVELGMATPAWRVDPSDELRARVKALLPKMLEIEAGTDG